VWAQAQAQLQEAVKGRPGRPAKHEQENPAQCAGNNPTLGANRCPKDRKSRLIRTLTNLKEDPEACQSALKSRDQAAAVGASPRAVNHTRRSASVRTRIRHAATL